MNARNDHKLKTFMSLFGRNWREGYFYFFSLLEICGSDAQEGKKEHTFHINTLRELWGTSTKGAHDVCNKCASSALVMCNISASHVTFSLPNLLNYVGKYETNAPNKEIKEIKEKKKGRALEIASDFTPEFFEPIDPPITAEISESDLFTGNPQTQIEELKAPKRVQHILDMFNAICESNFRPVPKNIKPIQARIKEGYTDDEFKQVIKFKHEDWINNPKMSHCVRPVTILGSNFDSYLQDSKNALKAKVDPLDAFFAQYAPVNNEGA